MKRIEKISPNEKKKHSIDLLFGKEKSVAELASYYGGCESVFLAFYFLIKKYHAEFFVRIPL